MRKGCQPVAWHGDHVVIIDQTRLPGEEVYLKLDDYREVAAAIQELKIRGAPAIGIAGAYAVALGARRIKTAEPGRFRRELQDIIDAIAATRPTARNLFFALERMKKAAMPGHSPADIKQALVDEAVRIHEEEADATHHLSLFGAGLIGDGWTVLTHCNTGPLATSGFGTALGVIIAARDQGKLVKVLATETRPLLQGARLTTWECRQASIPVTLITDSMAGYFMRKREVNAVITGADRIAANGDTANKIGTYTLAVLARENRILFYIAAPTSTIDGSVKTGDAIPIEERNPREVTCIQGVPIAPEGVEAANPAFDVTPHRYITAIITEKGIIGKPFREGIKKQLEGDAR
ncbi:MAG: S-methyl-5-thioribose-1-phosphate isomerase [Chloroflexi bacterium RBG_16_56_11]|nr:MAG: S-methyl-5-thioribose-1-phosphate isomerase [Chloroflexi bacterium RBG_16_56_11]